MTPRTPRPASSFRRGRRPEEALSSWTIEFSPKSEMYAKANEAGLVLRELARLGETRVTLIDEALPPSTSSPPSRPM
uniref:Uncharacterized protein n=1 Tax=Phenylobacterium glaciei TaxID=2803784 RepID=A0A974S8C6_9CAUL|nr:hypothetical protein JKL49_06855 [Phenylobacterium glaciei]